MGRINHQIAYGPRRDGFDLTGAANESLTPLRKLTTADQKAATAFLRRHDQWDEELADMLGLEYQP